MEIPGIARCEKCGKKIVWLSLHSTLPSFFPLPVSQHEYETICFCDYSVDEIETDGEPVYIAVKNEGSLIE